MRQAEIEPITPNRAIWRILLGILVVLLVVIVVLSVYLDGMPDWIRNRGALFAGDPALEEAAENLASAESRIRTQPNDEAAHLTRARSWLTFGNLEGARLEWEEWHETGSGEWGEITRALDELHLKTDEIRALLDEAESSPSPSDQYPPIYTLLDDIATRFDGVPRYRALFLKGYLLLREGRRAEAEPIFRDQLDQYLPLRDYVLYNHARSLNVTDNEEGALSEFSAFLDEFPSSRLAPLAHLERINILRDLGRLEDAINECRAALDRYPTSPFAAKTLRKWAEIYESEMDFDNGADIRVRILREFQENEEATETIDMFFGGVYAPGLLNDSDRLEVAYAAIGSHVSNAFEHLSGLADSENLTPEERARASHGAARCEYSFGRYYEAIEWAGQARSQAPGSEWADRAGIRIGHSYWKLNKTALAIEAYREVAQGHGPVASTAAHLLWERAYEISDLETVREACRYIVEEHPTSDETPQAMAMLAYLGCRDGEYQSARGYAERCLEAFPRDPAAAEAAFWLARALEGLGRTVDAATVYEELAIRLPWNFWGIRARELAAPEDESLPALDPYDFDPENLGVYSGTMAAAWELYDAGTLDLAESEFKLAYENGLDGALSGLALVRAEQGELREGVLAARDAFLVGDQAYLTPVRQQSLLDDLYPLAFEQEVTAAALAHDIPVSWLWGAMRQESCFNSRAESRAGARGLIQIMPETGRFIADRRGAETFDPDTLWNPALNLDYGAWYLSYLRNEVGGNRLLDILAAYNGGPGNLRRWRSQLPTRDDDIFINAIPNTETRNFTRWVYANIRMYEAVLHAEGFQLVPF